MTKIRSLADQLRSRIAEPEQEAKPQAAKPAKTKDTDLLKTKIILDLQGYDNTDHKSMVHVRFDQKTARLLNHFKMASGLDVTKVVAFAVRRLLEQQPEIKSIVKQYIQNLEL